MAKNPRWICLWPDCGHFVTSRPTGEFCLCGKYRLPNQIEIPRPCIHLGYLDLHGPDCHVQLTGEGMMRQLRKIKMRHAAAERWSHLDWQEPVDADDVRAALARMLAGKRVTFSR